MTEKLRINQSRLQITLGIEFEISPETTVKHRCSYCDYVLEVELSSFFDNLPDLEDSVDDAAKTNLHIADNVLRKLNVADSGEDAFSYYEKYGD